MTRPTSFVVLSWLLSCPSSNAQCPQLKRFDDLFARMDTTSVPDHFRTEASNCLDSLSCDYVMDMAAYAKQFGWHEFYLRCVARTIELGGELSDDPKFANLVFSDALSGADSAFYWGAVDNLDRTFIARNRSRLATRQVLNNLMARDQTRGSIYRSLPEEWRRTEQDTTWTKADSIVAYIDSSNFARLMELCKLHGELPLSDRYGWAASGTVSTILLHNGKNKRACRERWHAIWPYIIAAMDNCRTGLRYLVTYDFARLQIYGAQWFGTLKDQPVVPGNVAERLAKRMIE